MQLGVKEAETNMDGWSPYFCNSYWPEGASYSTRCLCYTVLLARSIQQCRVKYIQIKQGVNKIESTRWAQRKRRAMLLLNVWGSHGKGSTEVTTAREDTLITQRNKKGNSSK